MLHARVQLLLDARVPALVSFQAYAECSLSPSCISTQRGCKEYGENMDLGPQRSEFQPGMPQGHF